MRIVTVATIAALVAAPAFAQAPAVPAAPAAGAGAEVFQVLRPTDKTMTCEQISSEANMLNAVIMQQQQQNAAAQQQAAAAEQKKAQGRAVAGRLLGLGAALGGQAAMMNGALNSPVGRGLFSAANQMAASASQAGAAPANAAPAMPATISPQQQRMNMLLANYQTKGC